MQTKFLSQVTFVALAVIGLVGLFGQMAILHNSLVNSYPFKMMDTPPAQFYASIGNWGYYLSTIVGLAGLALSRGLPKYLTAVVPVLLGPLSFWLTFEIAHVVQGFSDAEMTATNFGGYTGNTARYEFGYGAFRLMFFGVTAATLAGLIVTKLSSFRGEKLA
ncbi:MAG: hypothetical protein ABIR33_11900 [Pyrinomonadaceae bacterium]